jgi:membrane protease YdiL (CAAX protease family)
VRLADLLLAGPDAEPEDPPRVRGRRRAAVVVTIVVAGGLLAATLRVQEGSTGFTVLGLLLAGTWIAGALASGPIPILPRDPRQGTTVLGAAGLGAVAYLVFLAAYLVATHLPVLSDALDSVLDRADAGSRAVVLGVALLNGIAEELFFRGAVRAAVGRHRRLLTTTAVYVVVTMATGNLALVAAAVVMGTLLGAIREASGGVLAPIATHLTWSALMILLLPR